VNQNPEVVLFINGSNPSEISLQLGEPASGFSGFATLLGWENIVPIINLGNASISLNPTNLADIFSKNPPDFDIWIYPESSPIRNVFDENVLGNAEITTFAFLASDPESMFAAVSLHTNTIGYLPESWITEDIAVVELDEKIQSEMKIPVLGITESEPRGLVRSILVCMQNSGD